MSLPRVPAWSGNLIGGAAAATAEPQAEQAAGPIEAARAAVNPAPPPAHSAAYRKLPGAAVAASRAAETASNPQQVAQPQPAPAQSQHQIAQVAAVASGAPSADVAPAAYGPALVSNHPILEAGPQSCACCGPQVGAGGAGVGAGGIPPAAAWYPYGVGSNAVNPQEFLCDGGDRAPAARLMVDGDVAGLGLEDTIIHYTDEHGDIHVQPSNSVCVYAPRFAAVRKVTGIDTEQRAIAAGGVELQEGPQPIGLAAPSLAVGEALGPARNSAVRAIDAFRERDAGIGIERVQQPVQATDVLAVLENLQIIETGEFTQDELALLIEGTLSAQTWTLEEGVEVMIQGEAAAELVRLQRAREVVQYELKGKGRLQIVKVADRRSAQPGELVNFILRFDNVGDGAVRDVVILDNLTTRLEYVEESQTCTTGAVFSVEPNQGNSLRLRWQLTEPLEVGEGGIIRFQCRVR